MKNILAIAFSLFCCSVNSQNRNNIWCFGDSAGINFSNINQPIPIHTAVKSRGSCVSICDTNSNLLFYAYTRATVQGNTTLVKNKNHQLMLNGDNIVGRGWYMELIVTPDPGDTSKYYLFSVGVTSIYGLYYSTIDMTLDSGRGAVTQKNIQLLPYPADDGLTAVKHANGRDWWVIFRKNGLFAGWYDNRFYTYIVSPAGINFVDSQSIGSLDLSNTHRYVFNKTGDKLAMILYNGLCETFDFDRCSGLLSNHTIIRQGTSTAPWPEFWGCAFSANSRYLYISTNGAFDSTYIIQVDLQNPLLYAAADTVIRYDYPDQAGGALKRGPDDKIYFSCAWYDGQNFNFPYPDTTFNQYNMNLSVINKPDSFGTACDVQLYSFYLGGARTYWGLPNNPDYDLPRLQGSACDTVMWTNLTPGPSPKGEGSLTATYISDWQIAFINASGLKGRDCLLEVFDVQGKKVFEKTQQTVGGGYFTFDLGCGGFAKGMYLVSLSTEKEKLSGKFVKE